MRRLSLASVIPSAVYAADEGKSALPEAEQADGEAESAAEPTQKTEKATAEDLVKDLSDASFQAETSLEGITYDADRESVVLSSIEDGEGNSYQQGQSGVFYAQYLVIPKDGSECYTIGRTITITDTEGAAHSETNGGDRQKEDTLSEEDLSGSVSVEVTSEDPADDAGDIEALEQRMVISTSSIALQDALLGEYIPLLSRILTKEKVMQYAAVQQKVVTMLRKKNVRDDNGEPFGFGTHMYRHTYGMKLTEMHLDDWTIAKLLGHSSVKNVKYYRRMSNQMLAEETRKIRDIQSQIILECLDGWEEEYAKIREDGGTKQGNE